MGKGNGAPSRATAAHRPTMRQRSSAGAAVARTVAAMPAPRKVAIELKPDGGSDAFLVRKALRGGDRVLSGPGNRFVALLHDEETQPANAAAADADADPNPNPNAAGGMM